MSSALSPRTHASFRHRIKEIEISPSPSKYPMKLELHVDENKPIKLSLIPRGQDLCWDLGSLPCDVIISSRVTLKLFEVHSVQDRTGSVEYTMQDTAGELKIARDAKMALEFKIGSWRSSRSGPDVLHVMFKFVDLKEIHENYTAVLSHAKVLMESDQGPLGGMGNARYVLGTVLGFGAAVAESNSSAKLVVGLITKTWEVLEKQQKVHEDMQKLINSLEGLLPVVRSVEEHSQDSLVQDTISRILDRIEDVSHFILSNLSKSQKVRTLVGVFDGRPEEQLNGLLQELTQLGEDFNRRILAELLKNTITSEHRNLIAKLGSAELSHYGYSSDCQDGTRVLLLQELHRWTQQVDSSDKFLWLQGQAGLGKSSIAGSLCRRLETDKTLGAHFFCKRDDSELRSPQRILNTIVSRLASWYRPYGRTVANAIEHNMELPNAPLEKRYIHLIEEPLRSLANRGARPDKSCVVVVDALDECETDSGRRLLLTYLKKLAQLVPWLKVVVTSRPDRDIALAFRSDTNPFIIPYDVHDYHASEDILAYVRKRMSDITYLKDWHEWSDESNQILSKRSNGLFIWAYTACKFIEDGADLDARLGQILGSAQSTGGALPLYALYTNAIRHSIGDESEDNLRAVRMCLGTVIATGVRTPLSIAGLEQILKGQITSGAVRSVVKGLGSVLYEDKTTGGAVRVYHQSFADYMLDKSQSQVFYMDPIAQDMLLGQRCVETMFEELEFNMCGLKSSSVLNRNVPNLESRVGAAISEHLKYSCLHWSSHLVKRLDEAFIERLSSFMLGPTLLYWIEVLSLLGQLKVGLSSMQNVVLWILDVENVLAICAKDAYRFMRAFYEAIAESTPHLYVSALGLAPKNSEMARRVGAQFPNKVSVVHGADNNWSGWLQSMLHQREVTAVAYSSDGKRIVSGSSDNTVRIWDAETGQPSSEPLLGHSSSVESVAFSPDGKHVVSGSSDNTVRIWDAETGQPSLEPLIGHSDMVLSVAFSPDGKRIVSASFDNTVRIWDAETGLPSYEPLLGHSDAVWSAEFSPDGKRIVSGSDDNTVRIWNVGTVRPSSISLLGHSDSVRSVGFSSDSKYIVSGSWDNTVRIWDADTGKLLLEPLVGHSGPVESVGCSPDGKHIVSGSEDKTVRIWDVKDGQPSSILVGHTAWVRSVGFSPDGEHVVSGSSDKTLRIWDAESGQNLSSPLPGHSDSVLSVGFSPDGKNIVSGSSDNTVRIWDANNGQPLSKPLVGHSDPVWSVAFSPDGKRIVSGSSDGTVRLWNVETCRPSCEPLVGHSDMVLSVGFSPSGKLIVSGSEDKTLRVWNVETGKPILRPLVGHLDRVMSVGFSPDGKRIVSGSEDKTVQIWDAETGKPSSKPFVGHLDLVWSVAFSPNGKCIVSGSDDNTVRIWDAETGHPLFGVLAGHSGSVWSVRFSPDGKRIASGSSDNTVRIWDAETGEPCAEPLIGHSDAVGSVAFSPDGKRVVSGSFDKTIRIWDAETDHHPSEPLTSHSAWLGSLGFPPNGKRIVSGFLANTARVRDEDTPDLMPATTSSRSDGRISNAETCQRSSQLTRYLVTGTGWVSLGSDILVWLPLEHRRLDDSTIRISSDSVPSNLVLDFSRVAYSEWWTQS